MINLQRIEIKKPAVQKNTVKPVSILHILFSANETSAPYNEHCLPMSKVRKVTVCTFFKSTTQAPADINIYEGNNTFLGFIKVLRRALKENDFDVIHIHALHLMVIFILANVILPGKNLKKSVFTVHTSFQNFRFIHKLMLFPTFIFARRLVCCSDASRDSFRGIYRKIAGKRLFAVRNGADINRIDKILEGIKTDRGKNKCLITSVGRLINVKNPLVILKAFMLNAQNNSRLRFVGEGPLHKKLLTEIEKSEFRGDIEFTGLVPREQVYKNLAQTDIFISASRVEGFPVGTLEAMACGCPVILSDIPQHRELTEGINFIPLVHPDNVGGFATEIKRFSVMPDSERIKIGQQCRRLVEARFSMQIMQQEYEEIYNGILNK